MNYTTDREKRRENTEIKLSTAWICIFIGMITALVALEANANNTKLDRVISILVRVRPNHKLNNPARRQEFVYLVNIAAEENDIPADLIIAISYMESSLDPSSIGFSRQEVGLMQVHGVAARGCELDTQLGQLRCGASWLRRCKDMCGTWEGALTAYASGECKSNDKHIQNVIIYRMLFWDKIKKLMEG